MSYVDIEDKIVKVLQDEHGRVFDAEKIVEAVMKKHPELPNDKVRVIAEHAVKRCWWRQ